MAYINIENLSITFDDKKILEEISLKIADGITVIHGESGAGKTTLLHAIAGIYKNYVGNITFSDDCTLAYCLQEELMFNNLTVQENMHLKYVANGENLSDEEKRVNEVLSLFGIEALLLNKVKSLSGGEKQRLKMAMITLMNPDIVLLDEPTAKLDEENIARIVEVIEKVWKNKLLLIVSHDKLNFSVPVTEVHLSGGKII